MNQMISYCFVQCSKLRSCVLLLETNIKEKQNRMKNVNKRKEIVKSNQEDELLVIVHFLWVEHLFF